VTDDLRHQTRRIREGKVSPLGYVVVRFKPIGARQPRRRRHPGSDGRCDRARPRPARRTDRGRSPVALQRRRLAGHSGPLRPGEARGVRPHLGRGTRRPPLALTVVRTLPLRTTHSRPWPHEVCWSARSGAGVRFHTYPS